MSMPVRRHRVRAAATVMAIAAAVGLGACSSGSSGSSAASSSGVVGSAAGSAGSGALTEPSAPAQPAAPAQPGQSGQSSVKGADPASTVARAASAQLLARTASMSMTVTDLAEAAARARGVALAAGGQVSQENLQTGPGPDPSSPATPSTGASRPEGTGTMVLQVPGDKLDVTLDALSRIGTVADRQIGTEDVTGQVVDTQARLATMKESVARVRALMARATKLSDIVTLEGEVSRRQADLESLESQLDSLRGRVAMSPITLTFWTGSAPAPAERTTGFLGGLASGWHAFTAATTVLVTALGAVLPFGILAAVVGIPLLALVRRRRAAQAVPPPAGATQPPADKATPETVSPQG